MAFAKKSVLLAALLIASGSTGQARAGFAIGDVITGGFTSTDSGPYGTPGMGVVASTPVGFQVKADDAFIFTAGLTQDLLTFTLGTGPVNFGGQVFNGVVFTDSQPNILGVSLLSTSIGGLDSSRVAFTADSISVNFSGLQFNSGDTFSLSIGAATVPEPSSVALLGVAVTAGAAIARFRRKGTRA